MDRGASWAIVHGVAKSQTRLSTYTHTEHQILFPGTGDRGRASQGKCSAFTTLLPLSEHQDYHAVSLAS